MGDNGLRRSGRTCGSRRSRAGDGLGGFELGLSGIRVKREEEARVESTDLAAACLRRGGLGRAGDRGLGVSSLELV